MNASNTDAADYSRPGASSPSDPHPSPISTDDAGDSALLHVPDTCAKMRLDAALAGLLPQYSRSRLQSWIKDGLILLDGEPAEPKQKVWGGEAVELLASDVPLSGTVVAEEVPFPIAYEDEHIIVVDKPVGMVVHPGSGNWSGTLQNGLLHYAPALAAVPRAGIVHRLDKDTSGLLVVAKTIEAQTDLVRQLQARTVKRHYLALALGALTGRGTVDEPIGRHPSQRTKMAVVRQGREARTHYLVRQSLPKCTLVECHLDTGRTHQIRVHLAHLGHPLVGDATYGRRRSGSDVLDAFPRQALHAWRLGLNHPATGEPMDWESPLPADFANLMEQLGASFEGTSL